MPKAEVANIWGKRHYNSYGYSGVCQYQASVFIRRAFISVLQDPLAYIFYHENSDNSLLEKVGN